MRNIPELLAPVGGPAQLHAAVNNGADAVYLGGARFNARVKADNFGGAKLADAIRYAHERNVKVYVTFNTLLKDIELADALRYGAELYEAGADAVIVQDMGLVRMLRKYVPGLPLHMSTQGTIYNPQAVPLMKRLGIKRIVPARELTLEEIRSFTAECHRRGPAASGTFGCGPAEMGNFGGGPAAEASCEVEVFVHGALCVCYSGQCQMSRLLGGSDGKNGVRSGNRGLCAQPCRLPYTDDRGKLGYFLSPKDLCLLEEIPALCEAGVDSFKIEGRLKSPEYVAVVTSIYRKYLDQYAASGRVRIDPRDSDALRQIYCRGDFTKGYLYGDPGEKLLSGASPKHTGVYIGKVRSVVREDKKEVRGAARKGAFLVDVDLAGKLSEGDGVEIRSQNATAGGVVTYLRQIPGGVRIGDIKGEFAAGDPVYKVTDHALLAKAGQSFAKDTRDPDAAQLDGRMARKLRVQMEFTAETGNPASLVIREAAPAGHEDPDGPAEASCQSQKPVEQALKRAADPERIRTQLAKLGGTPFRVDPEDILVQVSPDAAIPVSEINRMRREGMDQLLRAKCEMGRTPISPDLLEGICDELAGRHLQVPAPAEVVRRLGRPVALEEFMAGADGMPYVFPVSKGALDSFIEENFEEIVLAVKERGILVNNAGWILPFQKAGVKVYGGHGLNVYNEEARLTFEELGVEIVEASHEADQPLDGKIPLMITEHPVKSKTLTDRKGQVHMVEVAPSGDKTLIW